ncbi:hypothetical protein [Duganella sp. HH101]|uniref:hypothetical protein n=1 Tax=Duganella sp. HH101 TaxID=1781066 RepID=UPI0008759D56|nr:hypothetical protein [Duganella sp. HH101]OFA06263.1 D-mannose binding lectin [Duganella sp. HH101]
MHVISKLIVGALAVAASFGVQAASYYGEVPTNVALRAGDFSESGGEYCLIQQGDGNLVVYKRPRSNTCTGGTPIWASYSNGATQTIMQGDGNLVQYDDNYNVKWASNTGGRPAGDYRAGVNATTGSLEITLWKGSSGQTIWSTPKDPNPTPTTPTNPPGGPTCPGGGTPHQYVVCVGAGSMSQFNYTFPACSQQQAQLLALQNHWGWGGCRF